MVYEGYDNSNMPGRTKESLGYHTDDSKIYHNNAYVGYNTCVRNGPMRFTGDDGDDDGSGYATSGAFSLKY